MKCSEVKEKLNAFADHELNDQTRAEIQQHLMKCTECQQELNAILSVNSFLNDYTELDVEDSLLDKIFEETTGKKHNVHWFGRITAAASIMAALLSGVYFGNLRTTENSSYQLALGQESYATLLGGIE